MDFRNKSKIPSPNITKDSRPLAAALPVDVLVDPDPRGKIFCYIDDLITLGLMNNNWKRLAHAVALVIDLFGRPNHNQEPIERDELMPLKKLHAEGSLEEQKIILGWHFDFRDLSISLPKDKFEDWSDQLKTYIKDKKGCMKDLESTVGRNGHASQIISLGKHFNNRLRNKVLHCKNKKSIEKFSDRELSDLKLWMRFYEKAHEGISFNLIVFRQPSKIYLSDSCPYGMGRFSVNSGRAWKLKLPSHVIDLVSNNVLEFMAKITCI